MASIPFTLAALATSAVPGLSVFGVRAGEPRTDYAEAIVMSEDEELLVRIPRTQAAEVEQQAELLGLQALTEGPRSQLPFAVPESRGMTRAGQTRAVVTTNLHGALFDAADLEPDSILNKSIAETIAAIHSLPISVAQQGGLPVASATDLRLSATRLIDRIDGTRLLPETVLRRWMTVVEAQDLWDLTPHMVHGSLDADSLRVADDRVTGVLGWSAFGVGDPSSDFSWLFAAGADVAATVAEHYARLHNPGMLEKLLSRAALYHELEAGKWLLHGVESHDQEIVDDAVEMLDRLVTGGRTLVEAVRAARDRAPLSEESAEQILEDTPLDVVDHLSDTAAYEALDEDRMFGVDEDFSEPASDSDAPNRTDATDSTDATGTATTSDTADTTDASGSSTETDALETDVLDTESFDTESFDTGAFDTDALRGRDGDADGIDSPSGERGGSGSPSGERGGSAER